MKDIMEKREGAATQTQSLAAIERKLDNLTQAVAKLQTTLNAMQENMATKRDAVLVEELLRLMAVNKLMDGIEEDVKAGKEINVPQKAKHEGYVLAYKGDRYEWGDGKIEVYIAASSVKLDGRGDVLGHPKLEVKVSEKYSSSRGTFSFYLNRKCIYNFGGSLEYHAYINKGYESYGSDAFMGWIRHGDPSRFQPVHKIMLEALRIAGFTVKEMQN